MSAMHRIGRIWIPAAQALLGAAALAAAGGAGFRLQAGTEAVALLFLFVVVPVAVWARPVASVLVSILAILSLVYFFTPPVFSFDLRPTDPLDVVTVVVFAAAVLIITPVMSAVRKSFRENAALRDQLRAILDKIPTMVWSTGPDHADDFVNRTWLEYTGFAAEQPGGSGWQAAVHPDDRAGVTDAWRRAAASGEPFEQELRLRRADGQYRWMLSRAVALRDDRGGIVRWYGTSTDIEDRKRAEEELRTSESRFALAVAGADVGIWMWDLAAGTMYLSPRCQELFGRISDGVDVRSPAEWGQWLRYHPDDVAPRAAVIRDHLKGRTPYYEGEWRVQQPDGSYRWTRGRGICTRDASGRAVRFAGSTADIDAEKRAQQALAHSEERYPLVMAATGEGYWDWIVATDEFYASPRMLEMYGLAPDSTFASRAEFVDRIPIHPEDRVRWERAVAAHFAGSTARFEIEIRMLPRGETRWVRLVGRCTRDASGKVLRWTGSVADVTERKRAEEALRESEARFRSLTELSSDWYWQQDENLRFTYLSSQADDLTGYSGASSIGKTRRELKGITPLSCSWPEHEAVLAAREPFRDFECSRVAADGATRYLSISGAPVFDEHGRFKGYQGIGRNITERKRTEEALRQSEERFALAVAGANEGIFDWDLVKDRVYVSQRAQELFGLPPGDLWRPRREWRNILAFHPDDATHLHDSIKAHIAGDAPTYDVEFRIILPGGSPRWFRQRGIALRDASGKAYRMVGSIGDITDRKRAQEELRRMERQLRQAQRLEAMGTLAGGIAHDFNNILGAILGYGEMALRDTAKGSRLRRDLDSIMTAGERGRALVERILAFSRSSVDERVAVHVERVAREALDQLAAKLPADVTIAPRLRAGRAAVLGDPTQVHQVLMNLAMNAIQAMPAGGTLRVLLQPVRVDAPRVKTTGTVEAGEYVVLEVADTGVGIPPDVLERIFDPFFTTKEVGVGTGLGLSLVHGIVTELGGAIDVVSTPGAGSTFTVYLPRAGDAVEVSECEMPDMPRGNLERVLVVDDEEPLVRLATETLDELGYAPVGFTSSVAALDAFRADPRGFDAVITDERMPGITGAELIRHIRSMRHSIPILLVSGYVGGMVTGRAYNEGADEVLKKPLSASDLATSLARVLRE